MNFNLIRSFLSAETATELGTTFEIGRPWLFFIIIPAVLLAIIPFFRLHKSRRYNVKHIVPLILHVIIISLATALITDMHIVETVTAPTDTEIIVVADMSDSNLATKDKMNDYIKDLQESAQDGTVIGVVVFANDSIYRVEMGATADDYLNVSTEDVKSSNTNIQGALEYAASLFDTEHNVNRRVLLMTDGRQTVGNAWSAAKKLESQDIRLDGAYFDVLDSEDTAEVQLIYLDTQVVEDDVANVHVTIAIKSTKATSAKVTFYEIPQGSESSSEDKMVYTTNISINKGNNVIPVEYKVTEAGIHSVYAVVEPEEGGDTVSQNNTLYSWFSIDSQAKILLVDGDGTQVSSKILSLLSDYEVVDTIRTKNFPTTMEALLEYDEVVLMNINFADLPDPNTCTTLIKRYVEEVGRGLVFTCGSNTYNYNDSTYANNPLIDILPVDLRIDDRRETIATVITVDLSSSMGQKVEGQTNRYGEQMTRYDMVLASVLDLLDEESFTDEDYIGVVFFDSDATIALPLTQLGEKDWIVQQLEYAFESYFYKHSDESNPSYSNRVKGGTSDVNGYSIKSYGTNYKFGVDAANQLLSESDADLKQMVFLSDGEPSDKNAGYDTTISRMANSGVITSTICIGNAGTNAENELTRLALLGHGKYSKVFSSLDLDQSLVQIAESIKGKPINEKETSLEKRNNSSVLVGVPDEFDKIQGYYGTTVKDGATMVLSADDLRPIIAEWDYGLGHTTVYMSDLGGDWSAAFFDDEDGIKNSRLVKNILTNSINDDIDSTGLIISDERTDNETKITVQTQKRITDESNEYLRMFVTYGDTETEISDFSRIADTKYKSTIATPNQNGTYRIRVELVDRNGALFDKAEYAVVGFYADEYDLFNVDGESILEDISTAGGGQIMANAKDYFDIQLPEYIAIEHNYQTPALIVLLVLFMLDLLIRNFSPKKKQKDNRMTDEERLASMRGR